MTEDTVAYTTSPRPVPDEDAPWPDMPAITPLLPQAQAPEVDEPPALDNDRPPLVDIPAEAQAVFDRMTEEAGTPPSQNEWVKAYRAAGGTIKNTGPASRKAVYEAMIDRLPLPPPDPTDSVVLAEARLAAATRAFETWQEDCRTAAAAFEGCKQDLQALEYARITGDTVTLEQLQQVRTARHDAEVHVTETLPALEAPLQAAKIAATEALAQAITARDLAEYNRLGTALREAYLALANSLEVPLERYVDCEDLITARRSLARRLGIAFPPAEQTLATYVYARVGEVAPPSLSRSPQDRGVVTELVETDPSLPPLSAEAHAAQAGTGEVWCVFGNPDLYAKHEIPSLKLCGIERDLRTQATFQQGAPLQVTHAELAALHTRYGAAVRVPDVWCVYRGSPGLRVLAACNIAVSGADLERFHRGHAVGLSYTDYERLKAYCGGHVRLVSSPVER